MSARARGFVLMSGGLDSQLAVRVLERAGAEVEAVCFSTPFFSPSAAKRAAAALGVKLNVIDFTSDEIALLKNPPHGFGGAMNPCIDCHATMIRRAGEMMSERGFDFVATGEVLGQRPMSQNRQSLGIVERSSGLKGRLVRPLSAKLLDPTVPETEGLLDREALLDIQGRGRDRQIALAAEFGIEDYPSPAGGCKLTEKGYGRRLRDLLEHEGLDDLRLVEMLSAGRRFRLPGGTGVILGRDRHDNAMLRGCGIPGALVAPVNCPGPTALLPGGAATSADLALAVELVAAYSRFDRLGADVKVAVSGSGEETVRDVPPAACADRDRFKEWQLC